MTERELTFRILTTAETAALEDTTTALEDLRRTAGDVTPDLDDVSRGLDDVSRTADDARLGLDDVDQAARNVDLEQLGDEARTAARDVDQGFDAMGRSAATGSRKIKGESSEMRQSLRGVGEEAGSTAREAAASFGSSGDIGDALQEVAANAPATLGPLGLAFGAVAGVGVGLFRAKTEALKERVGELVDDMIAAGGRLSKEFINSQIGEMAKSGELQRLRDLVEASEIAGVSFRDLARAKAGEQEAIERVNTALDEAAPMYAAMTDEAGNYNGVNDLMRARIKVLRGELGEGSEALKLAKEATNDYGEATGAAGDSLDQAKEAARRLRESLRDPLVANVTVNAPSSAQLDAIRRGIVRGIGPIRLDAPTIPTPRSAIFYNTRRVP